MNIFFSKKENYEIPREVLNLFNVFALFIFFCIFQYNLWELYSQLFVSVFLRYNVFSNKGRWLICETNFSREKV